MRDKLEKMGTDERHTFIGTVGRFGHKDSYRGGPIPTVLFKDVKNENGEIITDHLWFNFTKGFQKADISENDLVQFNARVGYYEKGYKGYKDDEELLAEHPVETDCKLSFPTKIKVLEKGSEKNGVML